jgi:hypothetical protein
MAEWTPLRVLLAALLFVGIFKVPYAEWRIMRAKSRHGAELHNRRRLLWVVVTLVLIAVYFVLYSDESPLR